MPTALLHYATPCRHHHGNTPTGRPADRETADTRPVNDTATISTSTEILGIIAGTLGVLTLAPQVIKALRAQRRHGHINGVSLTTWLVMTISYSAWLGISLHWNSPSQIATNIAALALATPLLWILRPRRYTTLQSLTGLAATLLLPALLLIEAIPALAAILVTPLLLARIPQIQQSWRTWRHHTHSDVAISAWTLNTISATLWIGYGLLTGIWLNVLFSTIAALLNTAIIALELAAKHHPVHN